MNEDKYLPNGQASSAQDWLSDPDPVQFVPPCAGAGLSHNLLLFLFPPPQVALHETQQVHAPHKPSIQEDFSI